MLGHATQPSERFIGLFPVCELPFNCLNHACQRGKVPIVQAKTARQLPDALNRIQIRAVGWQVTQCELRFLLRTPCSMKLGLVILGIVRNDDDLASGSAAALAQSGSYAALLSNRTASYIGIAQSFAGVQQSNQTYNTSAWLRLVGGPDQTVYLTFQEIDETGTSYTQAAIGSFTITVNPPPAPPLTIQA